MKPEQEALEYRRRFKGIIGVESKVPIKDRAILSLVYTPGVAAACLEIAKNPRTCFDYTCRGNTVAIVTDGSHVLSSVNVGPEAALPIMIGKAVIFKTFAGVDAIPICLDPEGILEYGLATFYPGPVGLVWRSDTKNGLGRLPGTVGWDSSPSWPGNSACSWKSFRSRSSSIALSGGRTS